MRVIASLPPCSSFYSSSFFWFFTVLALCHCCLCLENSNRVLCIEREREALLQFKHDLVYGVGSQPNSWDGEENDCCKWGGVVCDNVTGHIKQIRLRGPDLSAYADFNVWHGEILRGKINPSLQHLEELEYLDLSGNNFGSIKIPGFIGSLRNLRYLNISNSHFSGEIPHQLGNLSRLDVLDLSNNYRGLLDLSNNYFGFDLPNNYFGFDLSSNYRGLRDLSNNFGGLSAKNLQWLSSLSMLQHLDMSGVDLSKASDWLQVINTVPSLVELHLSGCSSYQSQFPIPLSSVNLTSLSVLDLSSNYLDNATVPGWIFNITSLVSLDLSHCPFQAPISKSSDGFRKMTSLQRLDVSGNHFVNSKWFLKGLSSVGSTLLSLGMSECSLSSSILMNGLRNMSSLVRLDLSGNDLNESIPESLGNFCNLKQIDLSWNTFGGINLSKVLNSVFKCESPKLESLQIYSSNVSGHLPNQTGKLHQLANLQLAENSISGPIPNSIGRLLSLEVLDLSYNSFWGVIPDIIGSLSSLKELDLSNNQLNGSIPESIGQILNLEYLSIGNNFLTGVVTENHFSNLTRLKQFSANGNLLTLRPHVANWVPPFQLMDLELRSWSFGSQFPSWLQSQRELIDLDISNLRIPYSIPEWIWTLSSRLHYLNMSHNEIHGKFDRIPASLSSLDLSSTKMSGPLPELSNNSWIFFLDLSNNSFSGSLNHLLCPVIQTHNDLSFLSLADNHLSGVIPDCRSQWKRLSVLDLQNNNLSGGIPESLGYWSKLGSLNLENNNLSGGIPKSLGNLSWLESLNMRRNKLSGQLQASIANLTSLMILQLGGNEFVGTIPTWIERVSYLRLLDLRSNKFVGDIPYQLCHITDIQILDLAHNNLTGVIPSCFSNFSVMSGTESFLGPYLILERFSLFSSSTQEIAGSASLVMKGREDTYSSILGLVAMLDLSGNSFSGHIPNELMSLVRLRSLNFSRNNLTGRIPGNVGVMESIESLDLSMNQLDGDIPVSLSNLTSLNLLNLSYNHLTGTIPTSTQLQSLDNSSFIGNRLCGPPLTKRCAVAMPNDKEGSSESHGTDWGLIISVVLGFAGGFWVVVGPLMVSRTWRITYYRALDKVRYGIYDVVCKYLHKVF